MATLNDKLGITQFIVYLSIMILSIGVSYGAITIRLNVVEEKTMRYQNDHELILILNTKIDRLSEDLKDIKLDLKELKGR